MSSEQVNRCYFVAELNFFLVLFNNDLNRARHISTKFFPKGFVVYSWE